MKKLVYSHISTFCQIERLTSLIGLVPPYCIDGYSISTIFTANNSPCCECHEAATKRQIFCNSYALKPVNIAPVTKNIVSLFCENGIKQFKICIIKTITQGEVKRQVRPSAVSYKKFKQPTTMLFYIICFSMSLSEAQESIQRNRFCQPM